MGSAVSSGMIFEDLSPIATPAEYVQPVVKAHIPEQLRDHARIVVESRETGVWWTIGDFRRVGDGYVTAVAMRTATGRIVFGVEN